MVHVSYVLKVFVGYVKKGYRNPWSIGDPIGETQTVTQSGASFRVLLSLYEFGFRAWNYLKPVRCSHDLAHFRVMLRLKILQL